jgi:hypothetical protein
MSERWIFLAALVFGCALFVACTDGDDDTADDDAADDDAADDDDDSAPAAVYEFDQQAPWYSCPEDDFDEAVTVVRAFDEAYHWFGEENHRTIQDTVEFPDGDWSQVGLRLQLECPDGGTCDHWDRWGSVGLVLNPGDPEEEWEKLELARHVTPYRMGMCQFIDVTPVASLLEGEQTLTSFIDTWVGPGHSDGDGWYLTVDFVFYPGPAAQADEVVNIWATKSITVGELDEDANVDSQVDLSTLAIPADATRVEAHLTTTGHSFGNSLNCAEFCHMRQDVIVNSTVFSVDPWRDDCDQNPVSPQSGTWEYGRNGWCPGATSVGHVIDITEAIELGADNEIDFDILLTNGIEYHNGSPVDLLPFEVVALRIYIYR